MQTIVTDFSTWTQNRDLQWLGTNAQSASLPFQGWQHFKEAFAPELIQRAIKESQISFEYVQSIRTFTLARRHSRRRARCSRSGYGNA
jgi:hypothetical protein